MTNIENMDIIVSDSNGNWIKIAGPLGRGFHNFSPLKKTKQWLSENLAPIRDTTESLFSGYGEQMTKLREVDDQIKNWTKDLYNAYDKAKESKKEGKPLDSLFWLSQINTRLKLVSQKQKELSDVQEEQLQEYYSDYEQELPGDYFGGEEGKLVEAGIASQLSNWQIQRAYKKRLLEQNNAMTRLLNLAKYTVANVESLLDQMASARADGKISDYINLLTKVSKQQENFEKKFRDEYDKHFAAMVNRIKAKEEKIKKEKEKTLNEPIAPTLNEDVPPTLNDPWLPWLNLPTPQGTDAVYPVKMPHPVVLKPMPWENHKWTMPAVKEINESLGLSEIKDFDNLKNKPEEYKKYLAAVHNRAKELYEADALARTIPSGIVTDPNPIMSQEIIEQNVSETQAPATEVSPVAPISAPESSGEALPDPKELMIDQVRQEFNQKYGPKWHLDHLKNKEFAKKVADRTKVASEIDDIILKVSHQKFFKELEKVSSLNNPYLIASMMLKYAEEIDDKDPDTSNKLLAIAEGILNE